MNKVDPCLNHVNYLVRGRVRKREALGPKVKDPKNTLIVAKRASLYTFSARPRPKQASIRQCGAHAGLTLNVTCKNFLFLVIFLEKKMCTLPLAMCGKMLVGIHKKF